MARMTLGSHRRGRGGMSLLDLAQQAQEEARAANAAREAKIRGLYEQNLESYAPGGALAQAGERTVERTYSQDVSRMIGAGLYGTTAVESTAGAARRQGRLTLESMLEEGRGRARSAYADFIERIENEYPDLGSVFQGYAAYGSMPRRISGTSPSSRPGWAISGTYGGVETEPSSLPEDYVGPGPTSFSTPNRYSHSTLAELYAQGRATSESGSIQQSVFAGEKEMPSYDELINPLTAFKPKPYKRKPYGATGSW